MSRGRKRRGGRDRSRQRREGQRPGGSPQREGVAPEGEGSERGERARREEAARPAGAGGAGRGRAARKRTHQRQGGVLERVGRIHVSPWLIGTPIVATVVVVLAVLILTSGSSESGGAAPPPDPRVAGETPASTVSLSVDNINFSETELSGNAGEVIEFVVTNTSADRSHTMVVAGPDNEYDTSDDFKPQPLAIKAGETGRVVVKIDDPGVYLFRCAFHPDIEFGTLTLE